MDNLNARLICAVREDRLETVRELINTYGISYSTNWAEGYVLLCQATGLKHTKIAKLLLVEGCRVNERNNIPSDTPLHFAARCGDLEIVTMLLDRNADINAKNKCGITPLHNAIKHAEITELLLNSGAYVNATDHDGYSPLHFAAEQACGQAVDSLLKHGAHVNCVLNSEWLQGYTALHFAIERGIAEVLNPCSMRPINFGVDAKECIHIIQQLVKHGANVNSACTSQSRENYTSLHLATEKGYKEIVELLLSSNADINACTKNNLTPLHIATKNGHPKIVKLLLDHGANVDAQDENGKTILYYAATKGNLIIIKHILNNCPNIHNESNKCSLKAAVHSTEKNSMIVENLLQYGFSFNSKDVNNYELLHNAVEKGHLKIVEDLIKYGADINNMTLGRTPLHTAIKSKQHDITALLINYGANLNIKDKSGNTSILYAIENTDLKITKLLLTNGANVKDNVDLLIIAVKKNCLQIVEILLQEDIDVNLTDKLGRTALHYTTFYDWYPLFRRDNEEDPNPNNNYIKTEICKLLLSRGANVNAPYEYGITTLFGAVQHGYENVVEILLKYNANVDIAVKYRGSPLYVSAKNGNKVICEMLLKTGVNVNAKQQNEMPVLHIATQAGHKEVVEVLLTFGADINLRDEYGRTALHIASDKGYDKVVKALLESGSDFNIETTKKCTALDFAIAKAKADPEDTYYYHGFHNNCSTTSKIIVDILSQHIIKMKAANFYVSKKNLQSIKINDIKIENYHCACEDEIEIMKNKKINSNINVTFYEIFTKNISQLAIYARNEHIVNVFKSNDYKTKFKIYGSILNNNFKKGMERKELLDQGIIIFNSFFNLPYNCIEQIFSHFSNKDIICFIHACKPNN